MDAVMPYFSGLFIGAGWGVWIAGNHNVAAAVLWGVGFAIFLIDVVRTSL